MALSRKHYKVIAKVLAEINEGVVKESTFNQKPVNENATLLFWNQLNDLVGFLKKDNPNFDSNKFIDAVFKR